MFIPKYMSPKEPLPIFRTSRYLLLTMNSFLTVPAIFTLNYLSFNKSDIKKFRYGFVKRLLISFN